MGNLCSIYHAHFDKLQSLTNDMKKAVFLDKCLFWWQISTYTLNDDKIWFTRSLEDIADEISMSKRTVSRYLKEFVEAGYLESTCKLSSSSKSNDFKVTKRLYIRITDKLLTLFKTKQTPVQKPVSKTDKGIFFAQNGTIEKDNLSSSIYKDQDHNLLINSTVSVALVVDKPPSPKTPSRFPSYAIEQIIGERIDEASKNYIKGMMANLQNEHSTVFTNPEEAFAEIVFSVLNKEHFAGVDDFKSRVQMISKLLRTKAWRTPKGFYNYSDYGQVFRKKAQVCDLKPKLQPASVPVDINQKTLKAWKEQLNRLEQEISSEETYLNDLSQTNHRYPQVVESIQLKLERLKGERNSVYTRIKEVEPTLERSFIRQSNSELEQWHDRYELLQTEFPQLMNQAKWAFDDYDKACQTLAEGDVKLQAFYKRYEVACQTMHQVEEEIGELEYKLFVSKAS